MENENNFTPMKGTNGVAWYIGNVITVNAHGTPEEISKQLREFADLVSAQQSVQPTPPPALICECGSLYGVHEEFCPKYKSAGG